MTRNFPTRYQVRSITDAGAADSISTHPPPIFSYKKSLEPPEFDGSMTLINAETRHARTLIDAALLSARNAAIGHYIFHDSFLLGRPGLILDPGAGVAWTGYPLGWLASHIETSVIEPGLASYTMNTQLTLAPDLAEQLAMGRDRPVEQTAHLLSLPGYGIYGHWLIDILPRLGHLRTSGNNCFTAPPLPSWGPEFMSLFELSGSEQIVLPRNSLVQFRELEVASTIKSHGIIDCPSASRHWSALKDTLIPGANQRRDRKLFISRSRLTGPRRLDNSVDVEASLQARGWLIVHPETLSIQEQAQLFSEAAIVIGEDGSGLHNTIFSAPGTCVICLNFGRTNIFHASIAAIRAHKLAYLQADPEADNAEDISYTIEMERLMDTVTTLQAA